MLKKLSSFLTFIFTFNSFAHFSHFIELKKKLHIPDDQFEKIIEQNHLQDKEDLLDFLIDNQLVKFDDEDVFGVQKCGGWE